MQKYLTLLLIAISFHICFAQSADVDRIRKTVDQSSSRLLNEYARFVSIPNIATDTAHIRQNTDFIMEMMRNRGIDNVQLLTAPHAGAPPVVYGEVGSPGATNTVIFYAHYDGQPVNPEQWAEGLEPFVPELYSTTLENKGKEIPMPSNNTYDPEWRLYARSAADDKAGVFAILNGYDALVNSGFQPTHNLKFFFEGEEEKGSPHLHAILDKYSTLLKSDLWIICDGPVHQSGKKQVTFGVRGDVHVDVTVYGPKRPLHSGHYGNWAPNPAMMLAKLLSSMKDENGVVTIKGFYDDVIPLITSEMEAVRNVPSVDAQMQRELGLSAVEIPDKNLEESIMLPSLNINGMQSGNVGAMASNQIPTYANAVLDLRLVPGNDWQRQMQKVADHIRAQGYYVIDREPTDEERSHYGKIAKVIPDHNGYNAQRTSMDLPLAQMVIKAVQSSSPDQVVLQPSMGGSLPLYLFEKYLSAKTITVPIANHDNNQHAENENIRLGNLFDGVVTMAALMMMHE